tara:strand:- start:1284 stop:1481 length:198 start_codon:yes stop_codon:yes gene_type:complete
MKIVLSVFMILATAMFIFNLFQIDWQSPISGKSSVAVIGVMASACAFILLLILVISKRINKRLKK